MKLQDGTYPAHLAQSTVRLATDGAPMLCFLWRLDQSGALIRSFVRLRLRDGSPNAKVIALVRRWAPDWDGENYYWFSENQARASRYAVKLTVKNEPGYREPTRMYPNVKWVNPLDGGFAARGTDRPAEAVRAELRKHLDVVRPDMADVWRAFNLLYGGCAVTVREDRWFDLVDRCRPENRDLDQFSADDWRRVLAALKAECEK